MIVVNPGKGTAGLWTTKRLAKTSSCGWNSARRVNADSGLFVRGPQLQVRDYLVAGPYVFLKKYKPQDWNEIVVVVKGKYAFCTCNGEVLNAAWNCPRPGRSALRPTAGKWNTARSA